MFETKPVIREMDAEDLYSTIMGFYDLEYTYRPGEFREDIPLLLTSNVGDNIYISFNNRKYLSVFHIGGIEGMSYTPDSLVEGRVEMEENGYGEPIEWAVKFFVARFIYWHGIAVPKLTDEFRSTLCESIDIALPDYPGVEFKEFRDSMQRVRSYIDSLPAVDDEAGKPRARRRIHVEKMIETVLGAIRKRTGRGHIHLDDLLSSNVMTDEVVFYYGLIEGWNSMGWEIKYNWGTETYRTVKAIFQNKYDDQRMKDTVIFSILDFVESSGVDSYGLSPSLKRDMLEAIGRVRHAASNVAVVEGIHRMDNFESMVNRFSSVA